MVILNVGLYDFDQLAVVVLHLETFEALSESIELGVVLGLAEVFNDQFIQEFEFVGRVDHRLDIVVQLILPVIMGVKDARLITNNYFCLISSQNSMN